MERLIQFTETYKNGDVQKYVIRYDVAELRGCFPTNEVLWLSEGKIVKRSDKYRDTVIVDLQAWFERTAAL